MIKIHLISAGLKGGPLPKADHYLDCRVIPNPHHALGGEVGGSPKLRAWVMEHGERWVKRYAHDVVDGLSNMVPRRRGESNPYARPYTVCCFCAYGQHRSPTMKWLLSEQILTAAKSAGIISPISIIVDPTPELHA